MTGKREAAQEALVMDGASAGLAVASRELFPFRVLFLSLVTTLWRAWHLYKPYTKDVRFAGLWGKGMALSPFLLSFALIIPISLYSRGKLEAF